ncbi:MAG: IS630 family transposase, partial [bacterium]|jgi:transposase
MARLAPAPISLSENEHLQLKELVNRHNTPQQIALRAQIILLANTGKNNREIARELEVSRDMVRTWRSRWLQYTVRDPEGLSILSRLQDAERPGAPPTFTAEQITHLFAIACDPPEIYNYPISHWGARELAEVMVKQNIVESISPRHVSRLLAEAHLKPHQSRYWLHPEKNEEFEERVKDITTVYLTAIERAESGERTISTDEMTGIQALERTQFDLPMQPGKPVRREFEYIRHGTQSLIASIDVVNGKLIAPSIGDSRTEKDFEAHIRGVIATDPEAPKWHVVCDRLNTHQSESLVRYVASLEAEEVDLGVKGKSGILKSMASRAEFLQNSEHRVVFHYTPKHCSWLNQIEIWFSILMRKLLRRESFRSTKHLKQRILMFIEYFNKTMAKPFKWTYQGKALVA